MCAIRLLRGARVCDKAATQLPRSPMQCFCDRSHNLLSALLVCSLLLISGPGHAQSAEQNNAPAAPDGTVKITYFEPFTVAAINVNGGRISIAAAKESNKQRLDLAAFGQ